MNPNTNTAVASRKDVLAFLQNENIKKQVALALPRHMNADRMLRVMLTTVNAAGYVGEKLRACTPESLIAALMKCSQYGLEPDGRHAHLIPYGKECQLIFDYKGLVALVRRSGEIKTIHADVVYEGDDFSYCYGTGAHLKHTPTLEGSKRGNPIAAYSFVVSATGEESFEVLSISDIEAVRDQSQGYQYAKANKKQTPWDNHFPEMCKKTAFRRHSKWLPLSFELKEAITADDELSEEQRFAKAKPVSGIFGALPAPAETETADTSAQAEEPPAAEPKKSAKEKSPLPRGDGERVGQEASNSKDVAKPAPPKTSDLVSDKVLLGDWMVRNKVQWPELQALLVQEPEVFAFADSTGSFDDLSNEHAKKILASRAGLEAMLAERPLI